MLINGWKLENGRGYWMSRDDALNAEIMMSVAWEEPEDCRLMLTEALGVDSEDDLYSVGDSSKNVPAYYVRVAVNGSPLMVTGMRHTDMPGMENTLENLLRTHTPESLLLEMVSFFCAGDAGDVRIG